MAEPPYKGVILDLKGVMYEEKERQDGSTEKILRHGARELLHHFKGNRVPYLFATNVTSQSLDELAADLASTQLEIDPGKILTSTETCLGYLVSEGITDIYLITHNDKLRSRFKSYEHEGFKLNVVDSYEPGAEVDAVVAALDRDFHARTRDDALEFILKGARIIALHMNRRRTTFDGKTEWNVGAYVYGLAFAGEANLDEIYVVGKPSREFYEQAQVRLGFANVDPENILVVGDDPRSDIRGGINVGMSTAFFPSMKYPAWLQDIGFEPDITIQKSLKELIPYIAIPELKIQQDLNTS